MLICDAHLDLSYNALRGRDVLQPAREQTEDDEGIPTVGLPDLKQGHVGLVCATVFCMPSLDGKPGYRDADEAAAEGKKHLDWYRQQVANGRVKFLTTGEQVRNVVHAHAPAQKAIMLLEGADPLRNADDVREWFDAGLRIVGLSWRQTRLAGGTGAPGPISEEGVQLVKSLDEFGIIHDASHLAEQSFWQLLDLTSGPIVASHSNCRSIVPTDRQLSDAMIKAIVTRGGVIGINFFDRFLLPPQEYQKRRAKLSDVVTHIKHICNLAGSDRHVALGTDMDGGLGRNEIPIEIETSADLPRLANSLSAAKFSDAAIERILSGNWLNFFSGALPSASL